MAMSVIIKDSIEQLPAAVQHTFSTGSLSILLYADDTLLLGTSESSLQQLLDAIAAVGLRYGMELHYSKFQLMQVGKN